MCIYQDSMLYPDNMLTYIPRQHADVHKLCLKLCVPEGGMGLRISTYCSPCRALAKLKDLRPGMPPENTPPFITIPCTTNHKKLLNKTAHSNHKTRTNLCYDDSKGGNNRKVRMPFVQVLQVRCVSLTESAADCIRTENTSETIRCCGVSLVSTYC